MGSRRWKNGCWQLELHSCGVAHKHGHPVTSVNGKDSRYGTYIPQSKFLTCHSFQVACLDSGFTQRFSELIQNLPDANLGYNHSAVCPAGVYEIFFINNFTLPTYEKMEARGPLMIPLNRFLSENHGF